MLSRPGDTESMNGQGGPDRTYLSEDLISVELKTGLFFLAPSLFWTIVGAKPSSPV